MKRTHKDAVEALAKEKSNAEPGTPEYLAAFQPAVKEFMESLPEDEIKELDRLAAEWTLRQPPKEVQRQLVPLNSAPTFR